VGEHGEGDVPLPARVAADFILVQAALVLRALEAGFDCPAGAGDPHQLRDTGAAWRIGEVVGDLVRVGNAAAGQYLPLMGRLVTAEEGNSRELGGCPVVNARALGSVAAGEPLPGLVGGVTNELVDAPAASQRLDLLRLRDRDDRRSRTPAT
jgi:hypothetical protein